MKWLLCGPPRPPARLAPADGADPRDTDAQEAAAFCWAGRSGRRARPDDLEWELDAKVEREQGYEVDRVRQHCVDMIRRVSCKNKRE